MQLAKGVINFPSQNPSSRRFILFNSKRVSTEITNVIRGSYIQSRGRSHAASVPSGIPKAEKGSKRVSKDERKAMVEAFVNKYREMHAGKFPSPTDAKRQVGGSYYTVKKILQELEYNSRISPSEKSSENLLTKELAKKNESEAENEEVSVSQVTADAGLQNNTRMASSLEISNSGDNRSEVKKMLQKNTLVEKTLSEEAVKSQKTGTLFDVVATESHLRNGQTKEDSHQIPEILEDGMKEELSAKNPQDIEDPNHVPSQDQGPLEADGFATEMSTKQTNDEELKKSTLWGNLKSFADGLVNMWKKL